MFGQRYEKAANSQAERDYGRAPALDGWREQRPESVDEFELSAVHLREIGPRQRAAYKGTMCLVLDDGALDFFKRGKITSQLLADKKNPVDDHHVFPYAYLNKKNIPANHRDCILNRTYIDRETNRTLQDRAPSDYLGEIQQKQGLNETTELLRSHLLPREPLLADDFEGFLKGREEKLLRLIAARTGC